MIKQKRSKVKQAVLPFVLETTYEIITPRAGLVLFGEFLRFFHTSILSPHIHQKRCFPSFKDFIKIIKTSNNNVIFEI